MRMDCAALLTSLREHSNAENVAGMARFGINPQGTLGVPVPILRGMARKAGKNHDLAQALWASGIHEARILATLIDDPARVRRGQMNRWAREFDSWDVCDQACQNLFRYTPHAFGKAAEWAGARKEFVKRAGFSLMAGLAVKAKTAPDAEFEAFLPLIEAAAGDGRNFVKKAVNWALRQIGKRNAHLRERAMRSAEAIQRQGSQSARWIASDALRELKCDFTAEAQRRRETRTLDVRK